MIAARQCNCLPKLSKLPVSISLKKKFFQLLSFFGVVFVLQNTLASHEARFQESSKLKVVDLIVNFLRHGLFVKGAFSQLLV